MRKIKTVKGYISYLKKVANLPISTLKGYDLLRPDQQIILGAISAEIDNNIGEYLEQKKQDSK